MTRSLAALMALMALAACGVRGELTPAPPMWGEAREAYERENPREMENETADEDEDEDEETALPEPQ